MSLLHGTNGYREQVKLVWICRISDIWLIKHVEQTDKEYHTEDKVHLCAPLPLWAPSFSWALHLQRY